MASSQIANLPTRESDSAEMVTQREKDRTFGLQVYAHLLAIALAIFRRYVGGEPKCKQCGKPYTNQKE